MPAPRRRPAPKQTPVEQGPDEALVWTDGACSGNPGPGGWAAIVIPPAGGEAIELSGGDPDTTNNRMELTAAIEGLRALPDGAKAAIVTDSQLMLNSMTKWLPGWKRKGWKTAAGSPVKNQDLLLALEEQINRHEVRWHWVKGHADSEINNRADALAVAASQQAARG
jgi:ribonuclease HI